VPSGSGGFQIIRHFAELFRPAQPLAVRASFGYYTPAQQYHSPYRCNSRSL
jgi:hypothetical protein